MVNGDNEKTIHDLAFAAGGGVVGWGLSRIKRESTERCFFILGAHYLLSSSALASGLGIGWSVDSLLQGFLSIVSLRLSFQSCM